MSINSMYHCNHYKPNSEDILKAVAIIVMITHHYYLFFDAHSNIIIYILSRICMPIFAFFCGAHASKDKFRIDTLICATIVQIVTYSVVNSINILFSFLIGLFLINKKQMYKSNPLCLVFFLGMGITSLILDLKLEHQLIPIMFMICGKRQQSKMQYNLHIIYTFIMYFIYIIRINHGMFDDMFVNQDLLINQDIFMEQNLLTSANFIPSFIYLLYMLIQYHSNLILLMLILSTLCIMLIKVDMRADTLLFRLNGLMFKESMCDSTRVVTRTYYTKYKERYVPNIVLPPYNQLCRRISKRWYTSSVKSVSKFAWFKIIKLVISLSRSIVTVISISISLIANVVKLVVLPINKFVAFTSVAQPFTILIIWFTSLLTKFTKPSINFIILAISRNVQLLYVGHLVLFVVVLGK